MAILELVEHWIFSSLITDWLGMKVEVLVFGRMRIFSLEKNDIFFEICKACSLVNRYGRMVMMKFIELTIFRTLVTS